MPDFVKRLLEDCEAVEQIALVLEFLSLGLESVEDNNLSCFLQAYVYQTRPHYVTVFD